MKLREGETKLFVGNLLLVAVWFAAWLILGDRYWLLAVINRAVPYLFIPSVVLLFLAISLRQRRAVLLAVLPLTLFLYLYGVHFIPRRLYPGIDKSLRVMTFNVLFSNQRYEQVAELIRGYEPDLVALQEVQPEMMQALQVNLSSEYPYSFLAAAHDYGTTAVFSKHPFLKADSVSLGVDREASVVEVEVKGFRVQFIAAHLTAYGLQNYPVSDFPEVITLRTQQQNEQARKLIEVLNNDPWTIRILACDCNTKEISSTHRILNRYLQNTSRQAGYWYGVPLMANEVRDLNIQHIDYILFDGPLFVLSSRSNIETAGSDHRPLIADFVFAIRGETDGSWIPPLPMPVLEDE